MPVSTRPPPVALYKARIDADLAVQKAAATRPNRYKQFQQTYRNNLAGFVSDCITWREGDGPTPYQIEILEELPVKKRASVRGPHGLGKTALESWVLLHFALTRDGEDWKAPTTASAWRQLTKYLWPEIHKWARALRWDRIGREPFDARLELQTLSLKLETGEAFAVASSIPELIEGAHADSLLYLFDESKEISGETFDAAEGAFSNAGNAAGNEAFALSCSTPGEPGGRFYEIQSHRPGTEDWWVRAVTLDEVIKAGRVSPSWVEQRKLQWGEGSAVFKNRVEGQFAASDEDGVVPLAWIEAANQRWADWQESGAATAPFTCVGVDVADSGSDKTVMAMRCGQIITELRRTAMEDTMQTAGRVKGILDKHPGYAVIDGIGIGAGVVARLNEQNCEVVSFIASGKNEDRDISGELGFSNERAAAWWKMRELLDPANGHAVALPPDDFLTGDLVSPHWRVVSGAKILIESKDDIRKRLGRSTDDGDAVVMSFTDMHSWRWV